MTINVYCNSQTTFHIQTVGDVTTYTVGGPEGCDVPNINPYEY